MNCRLFFSVIGCLMLSATLYVPLSMADDTGRFEKAMDHYREARYDSAASLFSTIDTPEARLFAGKSYFSLSEYLLAKYHLRNIRREDGIQLFEEACFTLAMALFQTRNYGESLDLLFPMASRTGEQTLEREARNLYQQILAYLTITQRKSAFMQSRVPRVQMSLFEEGMKRMTRPEAEDLFDALLPYFEVVGGRTFIPQMRSRISRLPKERPADAPFPKAPDGMVYNIGVLLPDAETGSGKWRVARSLYFGYLLAVKEFNENNPKNLVRLHKVELSDTSLTHEAAIARMAWKYHADALLGPLSSDAAYRMRDLIENYRIPLIPPLANADTLNIHHPYLYQINPTFEARGREMARFAVKELELDTLAVITQSNLPVHREAQAFRNEAERLGARVLHYFSENFEKRAFEVGHITPWFAGHQRYVDEEEYPLVPIKGLYLSLTGEGTEQLLELILNDLQATRSRVTLLGNEEVAHLPMNPQQRGFFNLYYHTFFHIDSERRETWAFQQNYEALSGIKADEFAHIGYDTATFLFNTLQKVQNPDYLKEQMRHQPRMEGTIANIDFQGSHINRQLHYFEMTRDGPRLYEFIEKKESDEEGEKK